MKLILVRMHRKQKLHVHVFMAVHPLMQTNDELLTDFTPIPGYEGLYSINRLGQVLSHRSGLLLKHNSSGLYYRVHLTAANGYDDNQNVHRLLAKCFIPNPDNLPWINHKDGNKRNNNLDNLEWCTPRDNIIHALVNGLQQSGERSVRAKLTNSDVKQIRGDYMVNSDRPMHFAAKAAKQYNVSIRTIRGILDSSKWRYI